MRNEENDFRYAFFRGGRGISRGACGNGVRSRGVHDFGPDHDHRWGGSRDAIVWIDPIHTARTDSLGDYTIGGLLNGEYEIRVWSKHCLASVMDTVTVQNDDLAGVNDTVVAADIVEDGRINLYDAGELLRHYGATPDSSSWDGALDFDGNGVIDSLDTAVLMRCWKVGNDVAPPVFMAVLEPNGSTVWPVGQKNVPIRWNTGNLAGPVAISLLLGHDLIGEITPSTPNNGSYRIRYPRRPRSGERVPSPRVPYRQRRQRNERILRGSAVHNRYRADERHYLERRSERGSRKLDDRKLDGGVSINLYSGAAFVRALVSENVNSGTRLVDAPSDIPAGSNYRIQVNLSADHADFSDCFSIRDTFFVVTMPDTNTAWLRGHKTSPLGEDGFHDRECGDRSVSGRYSGGDDCSLDTE